MRNLFHGMVVKCLIGDDFNNSDDRKCNKVMMKESVLFYSECWLDRCKASHDEEKQKERLKQWYDNVLSTMENVDVSA